MQTEIIKSIINQAYDLDLELYPLVGWDDVNFKGVSIDSSEIYLIKISNKSTSIKNLDFQNRLISFVSEQELNFNTPSIIRNREDKGITTIVDNQFMRILSWVPGDMIAKVNPQNADFLFNLGQIVGELSKILFKFKDQEGKYGHTWDSSQISWMHEKISFIKSAKVRSQVDYFLLLANENKEVYKLLRQSICHNDLNDYNLLTDLSVSNKKITGIIDFGDAVHTHTINELAITIAYVGMGKEDPLQSMCDVIKWYHTVFPLEDIELDILYVQIGLRLSISTVHSVENQIKYPENEYLFVSTNATLNLLEYWKDINLNFIKYSFRYVCGLEPCTKNIVFNKFIRDIKYSSIIDFDKKKIIHLDLSISSEVLGSFDNYSSTNKMSDTISRILKDPIKNIGIGGYGEIRPFYLTNNYEVQRNNGTNYRAQHLGIDVWTQSGTKIYSPYDGIVYSIINNSGHLDYGPTLIIEHFLPDHSSFFSLYGHLSKSSLALNNKGAKVKAGACIGFIGDQTENGGWPPHLHFQVILDMLDYTSDFPGVVIPDTWNVWSNICPDPAYLFSLKSDLHHRESQNLLDRRQKNLGQNLSLSYKKPLHMIRGHMQYLIDDEGRRYLDLVNNVAHVGHENPRIVRAGQRQMALLNTNTRYLHNHIIDYSEELLDTFPDPLNTIFFTNSGSEANELALRIARTTTGRQHMIALEGAYHGNTGACIDVSSYKFNGAGGQGIADTTLILPTPDMYGGVFQSDDQYVTDAISRLKQYYSQGKKWAGFIAESIMSCAGQITLPKAYLSHIYTEIRANGGLCIADEVQIGFGRLGPHFWGFQSQEVVPDIVTLGKPMGNGHPIGAVITTREIAGKFNNGMEYFNTFGGNPVSCAIGRAVLKEIISENLQKNAEVMGEYLKSSLIGLKEDYPIIGDVRGIGLFIGVELVLSRENKIPAPEQATYLVNRMKENGFLLSTDGSRKNIIKIKPPMCINKNDVNQLIYTMKKILKENYLQIQAY